MKKYKTKTVHVTIVAVVTFCCLFVVVTNCYREQVETRAGLVAKLAGLQKKVSDVTVSGIIQDIPHALS